MKPRPDTDLSKPAAWRWILFVTLCLVVVSFWIPTVRVDEDDASPFTTTNVLFLLVCVGIAVTVVPATLRIRLIIGLAMLVTTFAAWALADPIRDLLGGAPGS